MICDPNLCTGCEACLQTCPVKCIEFSEDGEGFLRPVVDETKCIHCGRCRRTCPSLNKTPVKKPLAAYAFRSKDEGLLLHTSSGGLFSVLAAKILAEGGVVFGAAINSKNEVGHTFVEHIAELDKLRRSKYVQSRIGNSFAECQRFLKEGRKVLFCGTPCQIKALHLFLGGSPVHLVAVDFICHGVPSPGIFRQYLRELASQHRGIAISDVNFRAKDFGSAIPYAFAYSLDGKRSVEHPEKNVFLKAFLADVFLRRSCNCCLSKRFVSQADYTMCDFWTVKKFLPDFAQGGVPGVSQVFVFNDKLNLEETCSCGKLARIDVQDRRLVQKWAQQSVPTTARRRRFFDAIAKGEDSIGAMRKYSNLTLAEKIKEKIAHKRDGVMWRLLSLVSRIRSVCGL